MLSGERIDAGTQWVTRHNLNYNFTTYSIYFMIKLLSQIMSVPPQLHSKIAHNNRLRRFMLLAWGNRATGVFVNLEIHLICFSMDL